MRTVLSTFFVIAVGCGGQDTPVPEAEAPEAPAAPAAPSDPVLARASSLFGALPADMASDTNPITDAKVDLGRMLYYEARLSKNQDISCNSCHDLLAYGVDGQPTSSGHKAQRGGRNSPTTYNAALHIAQFWDGRAADVEAQAKGPVTNPIEMAMPDPGYAEKVLKSIPGYADAFQAAFPGQADPITFDNMALAIGAFERKLVTPSPFDAWLGGDTAALSDAQKKGLVTFMDTGCTSCHLGPAVGGSMYQKLGLVKAYETADEGRFEATGDEADKFFFKVPSLRNIDKTGPYFHDGSIATLDEAIKLMASHQNGVELTDEQVADIKAFLGSLTGEIPAAYVAKPELPASGPDTPAPDPS